MVTYTVTLDLTLGELVELKAELIEARKRLQESANELADYPTVTAGIEQRRRTLGIVLHQFRTATRNDSDGGPVGTARYAIR